LVKSPKLYFYDTGLATSLLGIERADQLPSYFLRGGLFENLVIVELLKEQLNQGKQPNFYFWRDSTGHEIDLLIERPGGFEVVEIKAAQTFRSDSLKGLTAFKKLAESEVLDSKLIYAGDAALTREDVSIIPWDNIGLTRPKISLH
jgi:predicted AAA+ superfamily ATPase